MNMANVPENTGSATTSITRTSEESQKEALRFAVSAARVLTDNRSENVVVLDLRGRSSLADYFVIGTGTSGRQMFAALARVEDFARTVGRKPYRRSENDSAQWLLADYVDVVVHVFDEDHRDYYDLEGLWSEAPVVNWTELVEKSKTA